METCATHIEIRAPLPISDALVFVSYVVWFCCHILWHIASDFLTSKTFGKQYWIRTKNVNILTLIKFIRNRHISVALLILLVPVKVAKLVTHCYSSHDFLIRQNGIKKRNIKGDSVMPFSKLANRKYAVFSLPYIHTHPNHIGRPIVDFKQILCFASENSTITFIVTSENQLRSLVQLPHFSWAEGSHLKKFIIIKHIILLGSNRKLIFSPCTQYINSMVSS